MTPTQGKISQFGGIYDSGMNDKEGLSLYEPWEANLRPDIFYPAREGDPGQRTWKRLRPEFPYIALRFTEFGFNNLQHRGVMQKKAFKIEHPLTKKWVIGYLVDWGPNLMTARLIDASPCILTALGVKTDDEVIVSMI